MGWRDAFTGGHTASVNLNNMKNDSGISAFGDAFGNIGRTIIEADAQAGKNKLIGMQLQNEQLKLDDAANTRADKNTQEYASTMTRDAWGKDKVASLSSLDATATPEATLNAQQAINAFYAPTKEMKADWTAQEKVVQDTNNKAYLADAFTLDPTASKASRQNAADALQQFYKPETAQLTEIEKRFKAQDDLAQTNFNNELREKATAYPTFAEFQKSEGYNVLLANADATGIEHVIDRYNLSDKQKQELLKSQAEIKHYQNVDNNASAQTQIERDKLAQTKWEFAHPQPKKGDGKTPSLDDEKDIVKSLDTYFNGLYGKTDKNGMVVIPDAKAPTAQWQRTRAMKYVAAGSSASDAAIKAQADFTNTVTVKGDGSLIAKAKPTKTNPVQSDPLGIRK